MLKDILRPFGFQRRQTTRPYGKVGGGAALPILGYLAWRYREPIGRFIREKLGKLEQRGRTGVGATPPPAPNPF